MRKLRELMKGIGFYEPELKEEIEPTARVKKTPQIKSEKPQLLWHAPSGPDFAWNPLIGYPRNKGCWCGTGKKAKHCCQPFINRVISTNLAETIIEQWNDFMTGHATLPKAVQEKKTE